MIDRIALLSDLQSLLKRLEADLLERSDSDDVPEVREWLLREYQQAKDSERTAQTHKQWVDDFVTQVAAAWVLSAVFARFLEDNGLVDPPRISGPQDVENPAHSRLNRARDERELYFGQHPQHTDRDYLLDVFAGLAKLPVTADVFGTHNPLNSLPNWLGPDAAGELLAFFQKIDAGTGRLVHDFIDPPRPDGSGWNTRFLGDLYQDLSEAARKKYALLQTPEFVEEFILDRTLEPSLDEFGLAGFKMIDPACGSGHFLLGAFDRISNRWERHDPNAKCREVIQRTLDSIFGVDVNPFAVAIARFRLLLAALKVCGVLKLAGSPAFRVNVVCGDSLYHGRQRQHTLGDWSDESHYFTAEDSAALYDILREGTYHCVVANPPYITPKDRAANTAYRKLYPQTCHMKYSLAVPFLERILRLAVKGDHHGDTESTETKAEIRKGETPAEPQPRSTNPRTNGSAGASPSRVDSPSRSAGFTGQITANSFMKREFGKKLIESFFPTVDLTHVIDTSGAYIPGHGTPTVILFARHQRPVSDTIRTVMGIRGEPSTPADPSRGLVWTAIVEQLDQPGSQSDFVSVGDSSRELFHKHPWSIGGGGASELKEALEEGTTETLSARSQSIGITSFTLEDDIYLLPHSAALRSRLERVNFRTMVVGDVLRDWTRSDSDVAVFPYDKELDAIKPDSEQPAQRFLWIARTCLANNKMFGGKTKVECGLRWYEYGRLTTEKLRTPLTITFAFVATHNHFVLDRGGKVFKQSAPVIKLPAEVATPDGGTRPVTEDDHLALLGLLNSSTACFWMKQVFYPKASSSGDISTEKGKPESNRYEFAGTGLEKFPVPFKSLDEATQILAITRQLDTAAAELQMVLPDVVVPRIASNNAGELRSALQTGSARYSAIRERMIALQEELDWEVYLAFGLSPEGASDEIVHDCEHGIPVEARPFLWADKTCHDQVPLSWRPVYERRRKLLRSVPSITIIEDLVFKRPWWGRQGVYGRLARDYEGWTQEALAKWLVNRLESYFDFDGRMSEPQGASRGPDRTQTQPAASAVPRTPLADIQLVSITQLADVAAKDPQFMEVAEVYRNDPAFHVQRLVEELVAAEHVPLLPVLRYKPTGLRKREQWEETWELQRREDAGETVADIPVPPKYTSADFISTGGARYWSLRGKLDVPKERWISFPHCHAEDGSLTICWAGYDHQQQATAISAWYVDVRDRQGGKEDPRLIPLLGCLIELLPWLKQWHNDIDPTYGMAMGDYFAGFVQEEARSLNLTLGDIKAWQPPKKAKKKATRKKAAQKKKAATKQED
jgi:hypothetical protein